MEKFDAQVLGVLDGEVSLRRKKEPFRFSYHPRTGSEAPQELPSRLIKLIDHLRWSVKRIEHIKGLAVPKPDKIQIHQSYQRQLEENIEIVRGETNIQKDTIEALRFGRLDLHFLIDSPGGRCVLGDPFLEFCKDVSQREGSSVATYALNESDSLAANLWAIGNQRYALEDSSILFHTGSSCDPEGKDEDKAEILEFINQGREEFRAQLLEIIEADHEGRHEIVFDGREAVTMGLADEAFHGPKALQARFNRNTGEAWAEDSKTKLFWAKCEREWKKLSIRRTFALPRGLENNSPSPLA